VRRPRIFSHHIYELKKGLRHLILFTTTEEHRLTIIDKLESHDIPYLIQPVSPTSNKINVFFGAQICIDVIETFGSQYLSELDSEEDFILGVMLGYDRVKQCERYLWMRERQDAAVGPGEEVVEDDDEDLDLEEDPLDPP